MGSRLDIYTGLLLALHMGRRHGLQTGYLELVVFSETRDRWAPVKAFIISLLFALHNGSHTET